MTWRYAKIAGIALAGFAAVVILVAGLLLAGAFSQSTARIALNIAGSVAGYTIECETFEGNIFSDFNCRGMSAADNEGVFFRTGEFAAAWRFFDALMGQVTIDNIRITDAELVRTPESEDSDVPPSLPDWPGIGITVGEVTVQRFVVALPDAPMVCLNGMARAVVAEPVLDLDANFTRCAVEGAVNAIVRADGGQITLDVQASDDGALAALLLGWDGAGETELRLAGSGPLTGFTGRLDAFVINGGNASLDIVTLATGENDLGGIGIDGQITLAEGRAPEWAPATAGTIASQVYFARDGGVRVEGGDLQWGNAGVLFEVIRSGDGAISGQLAADIGPYDGAVLFEAAEMNLTLQGDAGGQSVDGNYAVTAFCSGEICAGRIAGSLLGANADGTITLATQGSADSLAIAEALNGLLGAQTDFELTAGYALDDAMIGIEGTVQGAEADLALNGEILLDGGTRGSGAARLNIAENAIVGGTPLPAALSLNAEIDEFVSGGPLSGTLDLASAMLDATGRFALAADQTLDAVLETTRADPEQLSEMTGLTFTGAPTLRAALTGSAAAPVVAAEAAIPELNAGGFVLTEGTWTLAAQNADGAWTGETNLSAQSSGGAIALNVDVAQPEGAPLQLTVARSHIAEAEITGEFIVPVEEGGPSGMLTIGGNALSPVGNYFGQPASSTGTVTLSLEDEMGAATLAIAIALSEFTLGEELAGARLDGALTYDVATGHADGALNFAAEENTFSLAAGAELGEISVISLRTFEGRWADTPFRLLGPATLRSGADATMLTGASLAIGEGQADFSVSESESSLVAEIALTGIPVEPLLALQGYEGAQGAISANLGARLTPETSQGQIELALDDFALGGVARDIDPADLALRGAWDGVGLTLNGEISGLDEMPATFSASIPLRRTGVGYGAAVVDDAPVSARFSGMARAERFLALLPIAEHNLAGVISATLELAGTPEDPVFTGQAQLREGRYESLEFGTRLEELNASLDARADGTFALEMNASDGDDGSVTANGNLTFDEYARPVGEADVTVSNAYLARRDEVIARASGTLAIAFPEGAPASIEGMFRTSEVRIDLGQPLPAGVQEIEVIEINRPAELGALNEEPLSDDADVLSQTSLDISIVMPNNVRVEGYGVNAEWQGNLNIGGTAASPSIGGEITLVRGFAEFLGREFTLDEGRIVPDPDAAGGARIAITGSHDQPDLDVELNITGPAGSPEIAWTSVPALPRDEIISRVYFGRSSPQLSAYEAIQLAQLSGALGGVGGGGGVLGFARQMAGLDVLRIEPPDSGDIANPTVTVGKYVTDRVYVGARRDADSASSAIEIEVDITPNISAQIETGTDDSQAAAVNWQWDY